MRRRIIKLSSLLLVVCVLFQLIQIPVKAAGVSVWASTAQAKPGETITFTVSGQGAGYVNISGAINQSVWIENSSQSFTVVAPASGSVSISVSGVLADFETEQDVPVSGGATVLVVQPAPTPTPQPEPSKPEQENEDTQKQEEEQKRKEEEERKKKEQEEDAKNNLRLESLTVSKGQLTPDFDPDVYAYEVTVDSSVREIEIEATPQDKNVTVQGAGKKLIKEGENTFEIVTSSSKTDRTSSYVLTVHKRKKGMLVKDEQGETFEIIEDDIPALDGFDEHTVDVKGKEYKALKNKRSKLVLLYCLNEKQEKNYYIYNEKKNQIVSVYIPVTLFGKEYAWVSCKDPRRNDLKETQLEIDGHTFMGYLYKNKAFKDYSLVYLMDANGQVGFYQYEKTEGTLQKYSDAAFITYKEYEEMQDQQKMRTRLLAGSMIGNSVLVFLMIILVVWMKKR